MSRSSPLVTRKIGSLHPLDWSLRVWLNIVETLRLVVKAQDDDLQIAGARTLLETSFLVVQWS